MLFLARHFAERAGIAVRLKYRVVAKALVAAGRPDQRTRHAAFEFLGVAVRPGDTKRGNKMRGAPLGDGGAAFSQFFFNRFHGSPEVLIRSSPPCRIDPRRTIKGVDREAGIVGKG